MATSMASEQDGGISNVINGDSVDLHQAVNMEYIDGRSWNILY